MSISALHPCCVSASISVLRKPVRKESSKHSPLFHTPLTNQQVNDGRPSERVGVGELCSTFALLCYASNAGKTLLLCSVLCYM